MKQVPSWGPTNTRCHCWLFSPWHLGRSTFVYRHIYQPWCVWWHSKKMRFRIRTVWMLHKKISYHLLNTVS